MYHTDFSWKTYALVFSFLVATACVLAPDRTRRARPPTHFKPPVKKSAHYSAISNSNNLSMWPNDIINS